MKSCLYARLVAGLTTGLLALVAVLAVAQPVSADDTKTSASQSVKDKTPDARVLNRKASSACKTHIGLSLPSGPGHSDGAVFAGTFKCGSFVGFCGDFTLHNPDSSSKTVRFSRWPGLSSDASKVAAQLTGTWQDTRDPFTAASAAMAVWSTINSKAFRTYNAWLTETGQFPELRTRMAEMIAQARNDIGAKLTVNLTPAYTGQTTPGNAQVIGTAGAALPGIVTKLSVNSNGSVSPRSGSTDANGVVNFNLKKTDTGSVRVDASASIIDTSIIYRTTPTKGRQQIYRVPKKKSIKANASYDLTLGAPTVQTVCDSDCSGNATVNVSFCNPVGASTYRLYGKVGDTTVLKQDLAGDGSCPTFALRLHDEDVLDLSYCLVKKGKCFTTEYETVTYEVVCPPAPVVYFSAVCNCNGLQSFDALLRVPASGRVFTASASVNGVPVVGATRLTPGQDNTLPLTGVTAGSTVSINVVVTHQGSGAQIASWTYNSVAPSTTLARMKEVQRTK